MKSDVFIALSGGIDSLVSAFLLKKKGFIVEGVHFLIDEKLPQIERLASQLDIPVKIIDIRKEFNHLVIEYFIEMYSLGKTPNPCLICNQKIKFGILLKYAQAYGVNHLATGHYAHVEKDDHEIFHLKKGKDPQKDQSYFLARLTQSQLSKAIFPLGLLNKNEVKAIAKENKLTPLSTVESQDICFVNNKQYAQFLMMQPTFYYNPGHIVDQKGNVIGKHNGLHLFTIGQRKGINCPGSRAYYVTKIDIDQNQLIVGYKEDLLSTEFNAEDVNWIQPPPKQPIKILTKIRYRHTAALSTIYPIDNHAKKVRIVFDELQESITPGQAAVFYDKNEVIGSGWITI